MTFERPGGDGATRPRVPYLGTVLSVAVLYLALGLRSLHDHARPVMAARSAGDEAEARRLVGPIVSREPATRAATESVLENGNDAVPVPPLHASCWSRLPGLDNLEAVARTYYGTEPVLPVAGSQAAIQALPRLRPPYPGRILGASAPR